MMIMPKPTPTQEENDLAAMGMHVMYKEHDGSTYEDPNTPPPPQIEQDLPAQPEIEQGLPRVPLRPKPEPTKKT
jgi:hypothetical protein